MGVDASAREKTPAERDGLPFDLRGGPPRRTPSDRLFRVLGALVSVVVFVGATGGWAAYTYFDNKINKVSIGGLGGDRSPSSGEATNFLLVGTDSRAGTGGAYGDAPGQRSDTTILAHVGEDNKVTMVSFPRDTYVLIPEYTDADGVTHRARKDKFNSALSKGGPSILVRLVKSLTHVPIDHYISIDLEGFKEITDAIGGVDVCILRSDVREKIDGRWSTNTNDPMSGFVGGPGTVTLDGRNALAFVRQRYALPGWDNGRIQRQQHFMGAVVAKITRGGVLANPVRLEGLLSSVTSALTFDKGTDMLDLRKLASRLQGISSGSLAMQTLPIHTLTRAEGADNDKGLVPGVGEVQGYDPADLKALFVPLGGDFGEDSADVGGDAADPVRISVLNGSGIAGMAARTVKQLTAKGIPAVVTGDVAGSHATSRILYGSGGETAAKRLGAYIPDAELLPDTSIDGVHLIVGSSFDGLTDAPSQAATSPTGTTTATSAATGTNPPPVPAPPTVAPSAPNCVY